MTPIEEDIIRGMMVRMGELMDRAMQEMRETHRSVTRAAVAEEREACAGIAEAKLKELWATISGGVGTRAAEEIAAAIRARGT